MKSKKQRRLTYAALRFIDAQIYIVFYYFESNHSAVFAFFKTLNFDDPEQILQKPISDFREIFLYKFGEVRIEHIACFFKCLMQGESSAKVVFDVSAS